MSYGKRIRLARVAAELTQKALAERLHVSAALIGQYETGIRNPKIDTLDRIAEALELATSFFQGAQPFSDMDLISQYKNVILATLIEKGRFNNDEKTISAVTDYVYWKAISKNIISIIRSDFDTLSIQYTNDNDEKKNTAVENIKIETRYMTLDYKKYMKSLLENGYALDTFFILQDLDSLNKQGMEKAKNIIRELAVNPDYKK